jgi:hypothetical protein
MQKRIESINDATYRAMDYHYDLAEQHGRPTQWELAGLWTVRYSVAKELNHTMRQGASDRELNLLWDALRPEMQTSLSMPQFNQWVRRLYPEPKTPIHIVLLNREQERRIRVLRAQQDYEISRNRKLRQLLHPALG